MPLFAVIGLDHPPHAMARRDAARAEHRRYVVENDERIVFVGVCTDEDDNQCASFYVFDAESEQQVRDWLAQEPFVQGDVYGQLIVRRFLMGVNRLGAQDWPVRAAAR
jgi:uncharacterized protein YciI